MSALFAPAAERNSPPILDVLQRVLPPHGLVLEIASGTEEMPANNLSVLFRKR